MAARRGLAAAAAPGRTVRLVRAHRLGSVGYPTSQQLQRALAADVRAGTRGDTLLLLEHPPVFTLGRLQPSAENVLASRREIAAAGATVERSTRGGNVTFHGPGQLVAYPILDLARFRRSVHWYVEGLEETMIRTAASFGVSARRGGAGETGVWVQDRKLGAIGVTVSRWVTTHGVSLNVATDLSFFGMIVPCGLEHKRHVTSLAAEVAERIQMDQVMSAFEEAFGQVFECSVARAPVAELERELERAADAAITTARDGEAEGAGRPAVA